VQNFAVVRHGVSEEIGPRQNKQTLKYLVDDTIEEFNVDSKAVCELTHYGKVSLA